MSTLFAVLILAVVAVLLVLLFLGMFVVIGIFLAVVLVVAGISALFGGLHFSSTQHVVSATDSDKDKIPQEFNSCLLGDDLDLCRRKFTHWGASELSIVEKLSKQVKNELGARGEMQGSAHQEVNSWNGDVTIVLEQTTNFSKKENVRERYVLQLDQDENNDDDDDDQTYKIKELNWDY